MDPATKCFNRVVTGHSGSLESAHKSVLSVENKIRLLATGVNTMLLLSQTEPDPIDREMFARIATWTTARMNEQLRRN